MNTASDPIFRRSGLGGSDAPPVAGFKTFGRTAFSVYLEKIGQSAPLIETDAMRIGQWLEDPMARWWGNENGREVRPARLRIDRVTGMETRAIRHRRFPFMFAHVDRRAGRELLEVKVVNNFRASDFGETGSDEVPPQIALQQHHYLACIPSAPRANIIVLIGGSTPRQYVVERDPDTIAALEEIESDFWNEHVVPRIPPDLDGSEGADAYLASKFPIDDGTEIASTPALDELAREYRMIEAMLGANEARMALLKQQLIDAIGDASYLAGPDWRLSYKAPKPALVTDFRALAYKLNPTADLIEAFTKLRQDKRRFLFTDKS